MQEEKKSGLAIASLVLGILSILMLGILTAIPGIITGHMARTRAHRYPEHYEGKGMALAGLILSYIVLAFSLLVFAVIAYLYSTGELSTFIDAFSESYQQELEKSLEDLQVDGQ
jgi:amino acid transporter